MRRGGWLLVALLALALLLLGTTRLFVVTESEQAAEATPDAEAVAAAAAKGRPARANAEVAAIASESPVWPPGAPVDLDAVDRDRDLHGVVVRPDGTPVGAADVVAVFHPWRRGGLLNVEGWHFAVEGPRTRTAPDGTFALRLRRGTWAELRVEAQGLPVVETRERLAGERVRIVVGPGVRLRVAVLDEENHVLPGIRLSVSMRGRGARQAETNADGIAIVDGLPASSRFDVELLSPGWGDLGIREFATGETPESEERLVLAKGRALRGRVVDDATGAAVPSARVGMGWTCEHAVATDADGRYELSGWVGRNVLEISVLAEGFARQDVEVGTKEEIDFRVRRGFEAKGRVVDQTGDVIAGAIVELVASRQNQHDLQRISIGDATTGTDGRFRTSGLDPSLAHVLVVIGSGYGRLRQAVPAPGAPRDIDLGDVVLTPGRFLAGRFVDADGRPMPGQRIVLAGPAAAFGPELQGNDYGAEEDASTDDLGRFAFADLAPGEYVVRTEYDGSLQCEAKATLPADRDLVDVEMRLAPSTTVEVNVVDDQGRPVAGADVTASTSEQDDLPVSGTTNASGVAPLRIPWEAAQLDVNAPYGTTRRFLGCSSVAWKKGDVSQTFVLRDGAAVQGSVFDPTGRGLPRAVLRVETGNGSEWEATDDSGGFDLVFEKGAMVRLVFEGTSQGKETGLSGAVDCSAPQVGVVLHAAPIETDRVLIAKVTTPAGEAVAGATVEVTGHGWNAPRTGTSDAQGVARIDGLPARSLRVSAGGTGSWASSAPTTTVPAAQEIVLVLRKAAEICGVVVDADGKPAKANVVAYREGEEPGRAATDDAGRFVLRVPAEPAGSFDLVANGDAGHGSADGVATGGGETRIVLSR